MAVSSRDVERMLHAAGFVKKRQRGSHMRFVHPDGRRVTLPANVRDIPIGTLKAIERQSGVRLTSGV